MPSILVAPQEFKGSLTARQAAEAIARGLRRALPDAEIELLPMADGGPGTVEALVEATDGTYLSTDARDPLGRPLRARWGASGDTAFIEMAAASGLTLVAENERDPRQTTTSGTGDLLLAALDSGYHRLLVGVGGSATNDGGAGMAQTLGARLLDAAGDELPPGGAALAKLASIDIAHLDSRVREAEVIVAADVTNPLCGPQGASLIYGPQKGASSAMAEELDAALARYADIVQRDLGIDLAGMPGAGAAGGLAGGLIAFCGAEILPGFEVVANAAGLAERLRSADLVITGEGRLDSQSAYGKVTAGMAREARKAGTRIVAIAGSVSGDEAARPFDNVFALTPDPAQADEAMARAAELLADAAEAAGEWWRTR